MVLSQKIELKLNKQQKKDFEDYFNYSRYIYNKALETWNNMYYKYKNSHNKDDKPSYYKVRDYLKANKEDWEGNYPKQILETSSQNVNYAFNLFFKRESKLPKYKSKKTCKKSFRFYRKGNSDIKIKTKKEVDMNNQRFKDYDNSNRKYLKLVGIPYYIKMKECLRFNGIIKECVISCVNFTYYASFRIELDNLDNFFKIDNNLYCGVDLGIKDLAIINGSDGYYKKYSSLIISKLKYYNKKIDYYNRILSKKIPNSNNYEKTRIKLNHCYKRIKNIRNDYLNKITTNLCKRYKYICIEDLPINNLLKNRKLSRYIALSCWYTFKCMLSYKSDLYNNIIILAEREYPSSQLCSNCGNRQKLKLSQRIYKCPKCGLIIDRDFNASINLKNYGIDCINNYEIEYI